MYCRLSLSTLCLSTVRWLRCTENTHERPHSWTIETDETTELTGTTITLSSRNNRGQSYSLFTDFPSAGTCSNGRTRHNLLPVDCKHISSSAYTFCYKGAVSVTMWTRIVQPFSPDECLSSKCSPRCSPTAHSVITVHGVHVVGLTGLPLPL